MNTCVFENCQQLNAFVAQLQRALKIEGMLIIYTTAYALNTGDYDALWDSLCRAPVYFDENIFCQRFIDKISKHLATDSHLHDQLESIISCCLEPLRSGSLIQ